MELQPDVATRLHELKQLPLVDLCGGELVVIEGLDLGTRVPIGPTTMRVGTSPGSHLQLSDPTVSRLHFQLQPRRDGFRLVDSGSTNGTFVDGVRVRDADLMGGATLRIGATVLRLEMGREPIVWWSLAAAFFFMFVLVLAANLFADAVRDGFDPRVRVGGLATA